MTSWWKGITKTLQHLPAQPSIHPYFGGAKSNSCPRRVGDVLVRGACSTNPKAASLRKQKCRLLDQLGILEVRVSELFSWTHLKAIQRKDRGFTSQVRHRTASSSTGSKVNAAWLMGCGRKRAALLFSVPFKFSLKLLALAALLRTAILFILSHQAKSGPNWSSFLNEKLFIFKGKQSYFLILVCKAFSTTLVSLRFVLYVPAE